MDANNLLLRIQELLDGVEWSPDTLDEIAELLRANGYRVRDLDDSDPEDLDDSDPEPIDDAPPPEGGATRPL